MNSTFNNTVVPKVINYLERVLSSVSRRDRKGRTLKIDKYEIISQDRVQIADLIDAVQTDSISLYITISATDDTGVVVDTYECSLEIPRLNNNMFIIDGKYRVPTNNLGKDNQCRFYEDNIIIDNYRLVTWQFPKHASNHEFNPVYFKAVYRGAEYDEEIAVDCLPENLEEYKDLFKLTEYQIDKLKIKLDKDEVPDHLTVELIRDMYNFGPDTKKDLIIDQKIFTAETDLLGNLNLRDNFKDIVVEISGQWWRNGMIYLTSIQNKINSYFRTARSSYIEIPSNVNPLVYDALKYKIRIPNKVTYNLSFSDLIDPINTPENTSVNLINELNVCTSIEGGEVMYICYDFRTGEKVKIPYIKYLTKKVLKCEYYDYDNKKPIQASQYEYKLRLKTYSTDKLDGIELIEPAPDEKLSLTTRRIPLINISDSVRVAMGCAMMKQALQTEASEPRLIESGNDDVDTPMSVNMISYDGDRPGVVEQVTDEFILIKDNAGEYVKVTIPKAIVGAGKAIMTNFPMVDVGQSVVPNQVVVAPKIMKSGTYNLGTNAYAVYMNYLGYSYEDGVIISESYSKRMTHYSVIDVTKTIKSGDSLRRIESVGKKVKSKDHLVDNITELKASRAVLEAMIDKSTVIDSVNPRTNDDNLIVPNNIKEGYIVDVLITKNPYPRDYTGKERSIKLSEYTKFIIDDYLKKKEVLNEYDELPDEYKQMRINPEVQEFSSYDDIAITFKIVIKHPMDIGDKSTNSYGSKGEVSLVLPDECMPRVDADGHGNGPAFDIIMNPAAVVSRKNASQLYELLLNKCIYEIYDIVKSGITDINDKKSIQAAKNFTQKFYGDKFLKMTDEQFIKASKSIYNFRMKVGSYSKISYDQLMQWTKELEVSETENIYCPDVIIYNDPEGTKACTPKYAKEHNIQGKLYELGFVEQPVVTGISYMMKLHKTARLEAKVTSTDMRSGEPLLGEGKYRPEGQKIGEMELAALLSAGATDIVTKDNPDITRTENLFINQLLVTGFALMGNNGLPFNTEFEVKLKKLKDKYPK